MIMVGTYKEPIMAHCREKSGAEMWLGETNKRDYKIQLVLDYLQGLSFPPFKNLEVDLSRPMGPSKPTLHTKTSYTKISLPSPSCQS